MSDSENDNKSLRLESEVRDMKLEEGTTSQGEGLGTTSVGQEDRRHRSATPGTVRSPQRMKVDLTMDSPVRQHTDAESPVDEAEHEEVVGGDITVKLEPGKAPKLSRSASQKIVLRSPPLFLDAPDKTYEATSTFHVITDCVYAAKYLGSTEHALECDCAEEWDPVTGTNNACGEDSDCINRATKMECVGDCGCGADCQNQRFQRKQYANVTVFKTEKKGYGLRADSDLRPHDFIFEYIGEVINEPAFRRRMHQYDQEGIKHFYFMSLTKGEFVDATKKGNLGRFCNHSCNPNCYVDKWVVDDKLRMGIFAERYIKAGEELVFNYNVDRYGADPQPCYCGEPNCTGFIGGKTQTERATKLSNTTIEALGIEDGDGWDLAVAKKPRKKKTGEDDEEYVNDVQPKSLDEAGVTKVMATLMQCKEKWIAVKLLGRIQRCDDEKVRNRVVKMHGYQILKTTLSTWIEDFNVVLQVFDILDKLPRITRNKIQDSKIEETVRKLTACEDERVSTKAAEILNIWSQLEVGYRIPRMKRDPNALPAAEPKERFERREATRQRSRSRSRSRSKSVDAPRGPAAPSGPRSNLPQRNAIFYQGPRPPFRRPPFNPLPAGWFAAQSNGQTYYYSASGQTTWQRPTVPAAQPPPPPKVMTHEQKLQEIIKSITQNATPKDKSSASATPQPASDEPRKVKKEGQEKWRSYSEDKQKKLYENTLFPHIKYVMDKYKSKLPRDDLKRFAKEIAKKLVNSDFKNNRVGDPTKISSKQEKMVKKYVKDYFDKAVAKKREHDKKKAEKKAKEGGAPDMHPNLVSVGVNGDPGKSKAESDDEMELSEDESDDAKQEDSPAESPVNTAEDTPDRKRKREDLTPNGLSLEEHDAASPKKFKTETPPPPPPPPPPPADQTDNPGFNPMEDFDDSFHSEALSAVNGTYTDSPAEDGMLRTITSRANESHSGDRPGKSERDDMKDTSLRFSPMQLATPPTNGLYEHEKDVKESESGLHGFESMNPERLRQLGVNSSS